MHTGAADNQLNQAVAPEFVLNLVNNRRLQNNLRSPIMRGLLKHAPRSIPAILRISRRYHEK